MERRTKKLKGQTNLKEVHSQQSILVALYVVKLSGKIEFTKRKYVAQKMKFSFKGLFSKCGYICSFLKKSLMENFIFCAVVSMISCLKCFMSTIKLIYLTSQNF